MGALSYALQRRLGLEVYLTDPDVPIDSHHLERALRAIPMGRKAWLFSWSGVLVGPCARGLVVGYASDSGPPGWRGFRVVPTPCGHSGAPSELAKFSPPTGLPGVGGPGKSTHTGTSAIAPLPSRDHGDYVSICSFRRQG